MISVVSLETQVLVLRRLETWIYKFWCWFWKLGRGVLVLKAAFLTRYQDLIIRYDDKQKSWLYNQIKCILTKGTWPVLATIHVQMRANKTTSAATDCLDETVEEPHLRLSFYRCLLSYKILRLTRCCTSREPQLHSFRRYNCYYIWAENGVDLSVEDA